MRKIGVHELSNGMTLYHWPHSSVHISGIGVKCGSIHDPKGKSGMAHFVEHLISFRSRKYPDSQKLRLLIRRHLGGPDDDTDISTDYTSTYYGHADLLRRKYMLRMFDVMASFLNPATRILQMQDFRSEIARVHNEYCLRGIDVMEDLLIDSLYSLMYEKNPIRNRIDCDPNDLKTFTMADVKRFLKRYYVPKNMFVLSLGLERERAIKLAEHYFSEWKVKSRPTLDYDHSDDLPRFNEVRPLEIPRSGIHQHHFAMGFPTETFLTPDAETIDAMGRILEARLAEQLEDKNQDFDGGAYRTTVKTHRTIVHGMVIISFATVGGREFVLRAEEAILKEIEKLKTDLVSKEEFSSAIDRMRDEFWGALWTTQSNLAVMIRDAASNGDEKLKSIHNFPKQLQMVNRSKLRDVANKYFTQNYARVLINPDPDADKTEGPEPIIEAP